MKIGFTSVTVKQRMRQLQTGCPEPLELLAGIPGEFADERNLKARFADYRIHGEFFRYEGDVARWLWYVTDEYGTVPNPLPLQDVWGAILRFADRPVRLRRILEALAEEEVALEDPVAPRRGDFHEGMLHAAVRAFLSVENRFDAASLSRLYQLTHPPIVGWYSKEQADDPKLAIAVQEFLTLGAPWLGDPFDENPEHST